MALNFDKYAHEGNEFVNRLSAKLGHPEETTRTGIVLRAVLHTLRDSITVQESLHVLSQLPMPLKGIYVDNWTYLEKPKRLNTIEAFKDEVKENQAQYGEQEFSWDMPTKEIIMTVLGELKQYISKGEAEHIISQFSDEMKEVFEESLIEQS